jgi:hypothetical protein
MPNNTERLLVMVLQFAIKNNCRLRSYTLT